CPGPPQCAALLLEWLRARLAEVEPPTAPVSVHSPEIATPAGSSQGWLFRSAPYSDEAPAIRSEAELEGALQHLDYAVYRRYRNQLTRAERARLDNTIDNALFKVERYLDRLPDDERPAVERRVRSLREAVSEHRERHERLRHQARRADLKLS